MEVPMTKAVFTAEFHWGREKSNIGFAAYPKPEPQTFPRDFIDAAIAAGAAKKVAGRTKTKQKNNG